MGMFKPEQHVVLEKYLLARLLEMLIVIHVEHVEHIVVILNLDLVFILLFPRLRVSIGKFKEL